MPKKVEQALRKSAAKKGLTGTRKDAYIYGGLRTKTGWKPARENGVGFGLGGTSL